MTPTEQDKVSNTDIEKNLQAILDYEGDTVHHNTFDNIVNLVSLYAADRKRVVLEARLDELKNCCEECGYWHIDGHNSRAILFSERINELKQELESYDPATR